MRKIYFITGNSNKFREASLIIPSLEQLEVDLPEIQEIDSRKIIKAKLAAAFEHRNGEFVVEDTSLSLECLNGLPGPLIKWFLKAVGNQGLYELVNKLGNNKAIAKTTVGYAKSAIEIHFFEGVVKGEIVSSRGEGGFGFDPIFQMRGQDKTNAQLTLEEKNKVSMRRKAFVKLNEFLEKTSCTT